DVGRERDGEQAARGVGSSAHRYGEGLAERAVVLAVVDDVRGVLHQDELRALTGGIDRLQALGDGGAQRETRRHRWDRAGHGEMRADLRSARPAPEAPEIQGG